MSPTFEDAQALLELGLEALNPDLVSEALRQGANPNEAGSGSSNFSNPPLYWAVQSGKADLVRILVDGGAKVECELDDDQTSVHLAAEKGYSEILQLLLAADGKLALNAFDYIHRTPLMCAVDRGIPQLVELLIEAGSDINAHDEVNAGDTALHRAVKESRVEIIKLLLRAGADPRITCWMGLNAFDRARKRSRQDREEVLDLLMHPEKARERPITNRKAKRSRYHPQN